METVSTFSKYGILLGSAVLFLCCSTPGISNDAPKSDAFISDSKLRQLATIPHTGKKLADGLYQLTGVEVPVGEIDHPLSELPDPSPPFVNRQGQVEIYGSSPYFIRYANWDDFEEGRGYEVVPLTLRYPNGSGYAGQYTQPWDLRKFILHFENQPPSADVEFLVGGSMSPTQGRPTAIWPDDNINRRIFMFRADSSGNWNRDPDPIVGTVENQWVGHSYGGNFFQPGVPDSNSVNPNLVSNGSPIYFFYEKVSSEQLFTRGPFKTELFVRATPDLKSASEGPEIKILGIHNTPYPSTKRTIGGYLMEGPRPFLFHLGGKDIYVVGFSSGDFPTDSYTINYAWSTSPTGPYQPALVADGSDLLDLGRAVKARYGLSWVGRPAIYQARDGSYEMLFHGVSKAILPNNDYTQWPAHYALWEFFRNIYKVKLDVKLDSTGAPVIALKVPEQGH